MLQLKRIQSKGAIMKRVEINYIFLKDKIKRQFGKNSEFAKQLGISNQELSNKLNNKSSFTQEQIIACKQILCLSEAETYNCFFIPR